MPYRSLRPEERGNALATPQSAAARDFYSEKQSSVYTTAANASIQKDLTRHALELLQLELTHSGAQDDVLFLLDLGAGSGLSTIAAQEWLKEKEMKAFTLAFDISASMLSLALDERLQETQVCADFYCGNAAQKLPIRDGVLDAAIGISMLQWLQPKGLEICFSSLLTQLSGDRNSRAVFQVYPSDLAYVEIMEKTALKVGFDRAETFVSFPHTTTAKKWFFCVVKLRNKGAQKTEDEQELCLFARRYKRRCVLQWLGRENNCAKEITERVAKEHVKTAWHIWPAAIASFLLPLVAAKPSPKGKTFSNVEIFDPPTNYRDPQVLYARPLELSDGTLLGTWENYSPEPPNVWFPIVKSTNGGKTWKEISKVKDTQNNWGLRYQPQLYELPRAFGKYPKGTVLIAGSSIPSDLSQTQIEVYASRDKGYTWEFVSHVALGGEALPNPGLTPVWEPFLLTYKEKLIIYYADQRENATHSQKLSHQVTTDLKKWSKPVDDTKYADYYARPGMPTVAKLPNGEYMYVYEYGGGPNPPAGSDYWFPVYYRLSKDPEKFINKEHHQIISNKGGKPAGSPYVIWTPWGGKNGTIVVSSGTMREIFTNQALGDASAWKQWDVPQPIAYTRSLLTFKKDPDLLMIMGAGILPPAGGNNTVSTSVVRLSEIMKA